MSRAFRSIELAGVSDQGFDEAVRAAVRRAAESAQKLRWLEVLDQRAEIADGEIREFQVKVRVWFEVEDADARS